MDGNYYTNLNTNIRFTDDISFKLLGLVPLFSGSGMLVTIFTWLLLPWLVYTTTQVRSNSAPPLNETLNSIYIGFAVIVGICALVSIIVPLKVAPVPPAK